MQDERPVSGPSLVEAGLNSELRSTSYLEVALVDLVVGLEVAGPSLEDGDSDTNADRSTEVVLRLDDLVDSVTGWV